MPLVSTTSYQIARLWGHRAYRRFVVLSRSRTGSNMLMSMLNSHPRIHAAPEIFARLKGRSYREILDRVFARYPRRTKAVGFKIFYYHPLDSDSSPLWRDLESMKRLHVIHLKRKNILRTLVSRKIAGTEDVWGMSEGSPRAPVSKRRVPFHVDDLRQGFEQTRTWEREFEQRFRSHPMLTVCYEELVRAPETEFGRIVQFLGLGYRSPRTHLQRQNPERISQLIENYESVRRAFRGTQWEPFFEG